MASAQQEIYFNGKPLVQGSLGQNGMDGDVSVILARKQAQQQRTQPQQPQQQQPQQQQPPQQRSMSGDPATLMEVIRNDPQTIEDLSRGNPQLLEAALSGNLEKFTSILQEQTARSQEERAAQMREQEYQRMLDEADPFDPEVQSKIAEYIRQKNVESNLENALEHNPEAFARVSMLYIDCSVNGVKLKAFVDSGAQSTIMSEKCAKLCNIAHLIDTRFQGMAQGVGTARILGRVHIADLKIGESHFVSSFTIMESQPGAQDLDFLFGLDNLKRHQACIDLKENVLRIGVEAVPFLPENEIPGHRSDLRSSVDGANVSPPHQPVPSPQPKPTVVVAPPSRGPMQQQSAPAAPFPEASIRSVMELTGQPRQVVIETLRACGGNPDLAVQQLSFNF